MIDKIIEEMTRDLTKIGRPFTKSEVREILFALRNSTIDEIEKKMGGEMKCTCTEPCPSLGYNRCHKEVLEILKKAREE